MGKRGRPRHGGRGAATPQNTAPGTPEPPRRPEDEPGTFEDAGSPFAPDSPPRDPFGQEPPAYGHRGPAQPGGGYPGRGTLNGDPLGSAPPRRLPGPPPDEWADTGRTVIVPVPGRTVVVPVPGRADDGSGGGLPAGARPGDDRTLDDRSGDDRSTDDGFEDDGYADDGDQGDGSASDGPVPGRTGPGRADRRRVARRIQRRRRRSALREIPLLIGVAIVIALVLKTFLVQAFVIPSGSMENTIRIGDRVLVDKFTPWFGAEPHRGDVVVFHDPGHWLDGERGPAKEPPAGVKQLKQALTFIGLLPSDDERDLIKRVVAVGGDTVKCCDKQGRVTVNGTPLNEPYIHPGNKPSAFSFTVTVPRGRLFVMGDHRANSADSRYHRTQGYSGTVSVDSVVGRARVIAWPVGHWRSLGEPDTYASVADARGASSSVTGTSHRVASADQIGKTPLPTTPAELPLVMGVAGLLRIRDRRRHGVRSGCGGCGGRRTFRAGRPGGPAGRGLRRGCRRFRDASAYSWWFRRSRPRGQCPGSLRRAARTRPRGGRRDTRSRFRAR